VNTYTAIIHREGDFFVSQGSSIEEAVENLKEATELYLEEFPLSPISRSLITTFEVAPVASH